MKKYVCAETKHHGKVKEITESFLEDGWSLHTYQATGQINLVSHYLLFERES